MKFKAIELKQGWAVQNLHTMAIVGTYVSQYLAERAAARFNK